jgi:hypothetical protein
LADENLQNFPFETAIAERHARQMIDVDDARAGILCGFHCRFCGRRQAQCAHNPSRSLRTFSQSPSRRSGCEFSRQTAKTQ